VDQPDTRAGAGSRVAVAAARLLAVLAAAAAAGAVALPLATGLGYLPRLFGTPEAVIAPSFSVAGALLVAVPAARRIGWLLVAIGTTAGAYVLGLSATAAALAGGDVLPPDAPAWAPLAAWTSAWAWFPPLALVAAVLPQVLPEGRPLSPRWAPLARAGVAVAALGSAALALGPGTPFPGVPNPLAGPLPPVVAPALLAVTGLLALAGLASLVARVRRADREERRRVGWVGYGVATVLAAVAVAAALPVPPWTTSLAVLAVPVTIAVAAVRHRLYDLDELVRRTVVAVVLLAGAALAYAAVVGWVGALLGTTGGVTSFVAAFAVALAFHPARVRVQRAVDRLLHGDRGDPLALVRRVDTAVRDAPAPHAALVAAVAVVRAGLRLPGAAVEVALPGDRSARVQDGDLPDAPTAVPLTVHGAPVGRLLVARDRLGSADERALRAVAAPLAATAQAMRLVDDLAASRERLVVAREEERRRIRRDLHDGLGPQLSGVVMGVDTARSALRRGDRDRAEDLLTAAFDHARDAVADVRRLVHGLRPPALDELGLAGALRSAAPPGVVVDAVELGPLPAAVEVAAYRIGQEAVTNALRHAGAGTVTLSLRTTADALELDVADDGRGLPDAPRPGLGIRAMHERAAELGGVVRIGPGAARGTRVHVRLPLAAADGAA
jgi:two-component system, NarL family, sensor kinase